MLSPSTVTLSMQFVLYYKKYVIDALRQLICLDGSDVSSNMRDQASGTVALCTDQPGIVLSVFIS